MRRISSKATDSRLTRFSGADGPEAGELRQCWEIIEAKKRGRANSASDLTALVSDYLAGNVPDYQMSAWLMAARLKGMSQAEVAALTNAFVASGNDVVVGVSIGAPPSTSTAPAA